MKRTIGIVYLLFQGMLQLQAQKRIVELDSIFLHSFKTSNSMVLFW